MKKLNKNLTLDELKEYYLIKEYLDSKKSLIEKTCDYIKNIIKNK